MHRPSNFAEQHQQRKLNYLKKHTEFSKQLTIVDTACWIIAFLLLLIIIIIFPETKETCEMFFQMVTATFVSLRLGYTAKAGVENFKKISSSYQSLKPERDNYYNNDSIG